jgi:N-acetylglucosamine malate deacetylase 2
MRDFYILMLLAVLSLHAIPAGAQDTAPSEAQRHRPIRALLIVAHPDDEYEMAGTIYKIAKEISGTVDQVIITDGEAGYRYSFLAARYYGIDLTDEATGRARLPRIREEEARRAGRILGIQHQWFLNERDDHFTLDSSEALKSWNTRRVLQVLAERLREGHYDVVLVVLPAEDTHGAHKAASLLALQAVQGLPPAERPTVLGAQAGPNDTPVYTAPSAYPIEATSSPAPLFHFDRDVHFGFRDSLSYQIIVDWVISEHKSQGLFQTKCGQDRFENFWIFDVSGDATVARSTAIFNRISRQPPAAEQTPLQSAKK